MKEKKKTKWKKIAIIALAIFCSLVAGFLAATAPLRLFALGFLWTFSLPNRLGEELDAWEPALEDQVAIFRLDSGVWKTKMSVTVNGKEIDIVQAFDPTGTRTSGKNAWEIQEMLCVYGDFIYGMATYDSKPSEDAELRSHVEIFAVNVACGDCRTVYTDVFIHDNWSHASAFGTHPNAYYHNGKIVLYEGERTVSLDLKTEQATEHSTEAFAHPTDAVFFGVDGYITDPSMSWVVSYGGETRVLSLDFLAERNAYAAEIKEWEAQGEKKMKASGFSSCPALLSPNFSLTETDTCLWYYVSDRNGNASHILFLYDFEDDTVTYIGYGYTMESSEAEFVYPVPIVTP